MKQRLTDRSIKRKQPGEIWDELLPGFGLRIGARKRTYFVMSRIDGKQVRRTVGSPVDMTLAQAREKARAMLASFAHGVDPLEAARRAKREATRARRNTFAAVAEAYMDEHGRHLRSAPELQRKLEVDILPELGDLPVSDIGRADIKDLIRDKARVAPVSANRLLALVRAILFYAVDEEMIDANPAVRIRANPETARDRYLSEAEIKSFWTGLDHTAIAPRLCQALKFMLVTGQRRSEVIGMRWAEVDLAKAIWEIPAERTKAHRGHRVPLSPLALTLKGEPSGEYVFAKGGGEPFAPYSASQAMRREIGALGLADNPATPHDLRRTCATHLGDLGIDRLVIGKLLNHAEVGVTGKVYDLAAYAEKKRLAMDAWSSRLLEITSGKSAPSKVTRLRAAK